MSRKLASIQKIVNLQPIEGADKIELATVLGWHVVVSKTEGHKIGDLVCYIEVDSQCPETPMFDFLKERKYRVKTIKLRGQVSQGLIIPLKALPKGKYKEGQDITDLLGITKYDPQAEAEAKLAEQNIKKSKNPIHKALMRYSWYRKFYNKYFNKNSKSGFPSWIAKTDEDRIQTMPELFEKASKEQTLFWSTEKLDGQSATYFIERTKKFGAFPKYEFGVCSRNLRLNNSASSSSYWTIAKNDKIEDCLIDLAKKHKAQRIVLQGEIIGTGIQGNKYHIDGYNFYAFNLKIDDCLYDTGMMETILSPYNIETVPIIDDYIPLKGTIDEMVEDAKGKSLIYNTLREGKVWRTFDGGKLISFKVINPDFLLKNKE